MLKNPKYFWLNLRDDVPVVILVAQAFDLLVPQVFVELHHAVYDASGAELDDAVGDGVDEFMVMAREEDDAGELDEAVVESGY